MAAIPGATIRVSSIRRVVGRFANGVGTFLGDDILDGQPILVRFTWSDITDRTCRWEQAFSPNGGATGEVNWVMESTRTD